MTHRQWQDTNSLSTPKSTKNDAYFNYQKKYEQMSKQQQLIEQKKQEILMKQTEKKKKETEEALKKLNEDKLRSLDSSKGKRNYHGYSKSKQWRDRAEDAPATLPANIFSNDGSFLEQFQKISGVKVTPRKRDENTLNYTEESVVVDQKSEDSLNQDADEQGILGTNEKPPEDKSKSEQKYFPQQENQRTLNQQQLEVQQYQHPPMQHLQQPMHHLQQPMQQMHQPMQRFQQPMHHLQQPMQHPSQQMMQQQMAQQRPPMQQQIFTPQGPMPPHMNPQFHQGPMNPPQFNPMQGGMMLPPPMTPSSIPHPAPLNPGSIPSPSPLQPGSIPSPSPLQPYAIPPPSPLIPHSIPPPSPMVPHSIPPPSPLTPHSIPPPLPLRPQSIPPPMQQPPMFLSMVAPPPPPPPIENDKPKSKIEKKDKEVEKESKPIIVKQETKKEIKRNFKDKVKELFKNDDYSSSSDDDERYENLKNNSKNRYNSDSDSESEQKLPETNSDKESDASAQNKIYQLSDSDSDHSQSNWNQESQSAPTVKSDAEEIEHLSYGPFLIEDTQTQFPPDTIDLSNTGEQAPTDLTSDDDSRPLPHDGEGSGMDEDSDNGLIHGHDDIKKEPDVDFHHLYSDKMDIKEEKMEINMFAETKNEDVQIKKEIKQENFNDTKEKAEEPVKKKRRSRWASEEEKVDILSMIPSLSSVPLPPSLSSVPLPPTMPSVHNVPLPSYAPPPPPPPTLPNVPLPHSVRPVGQVGLVVPTALGGVVPPVPLPMPQTVPTVNVPGMSGAMISMVTRTDPALVAYAMKAFGRTNLTDVEWKKAEDHYKINLLYQDMMKKKEELKRLQAAGKNKYEYDSDEETEGGTWEHKVRSAEMEATQRWAEELTEAASGKHHIGDFLPPDELARFMEKYEAMKDGREPDLSDYKEFKLKEDNVGFQMLQKLGWTEGQGLGPDGSGLVDPVNKATMRAEGQGLGLERPEDVDAEDDEYDAYRKRMMLAYRFRPNPMNNPRRPYY